jgi:ubiquinone/menaquinone biosynthesis C-methylase UbiE
MTFLFLLSISVRNFLIYNTSISFIKEKTMEKLQQLLKQTAKKRFLDIGTGVGNYIHLLTQLYDDYEEIIGIDTEQRLIDRAKQMMQNERVSFEVMDAYHMSYPKESFDVAILSNSLHHLDDIPNMLQVMKDAIKPDGFIIISEMLSDGLDEKQIAHKMLHHFAAKLDRLHKVTHHDTFTKEEIVKHLQHHNLSIEDAWEMEVERIKENTEEQVNQMLQMVEHVASRIPEGDQELLEEKQEIIDYIKQYGYDGCTTFVVILRK